MAPHTNPTLQDVESDMGVEQAPVSCDLRLTLKMSGSSKAEWQLICLWESCWMGYLNRRGFLLAAPVKLM